MPRQPGYFGFTLAELLIALGILGVIATFTIPKILSAQQDSKTKPSPKKRLPCFMAHIKPIA